MPHTRNTVQRQVVLQAVRSLHNHPSAEDIYRHIRQAHPSVSRGTVYRNLNLLSQQGEVQRVTQPGTADRFDFNLTPHYHFLCRGCHGVFDVTMPYFENILDQVQNPEGYLFEKCTVSFEGLCPGCQQSQAARR